MKRHIVKLADLAKKNAVNCPWCNSIGSVAYFHHLKSEVKELESAFKCLSPRNPS